MFSPLLIITVDLPLNEKPDPHVQQRTDVFLLFKHKLDECKAGKKKGNITVRHRHTHTHTCNLASVDLEAQGDAVLPGLRSDADKACQNRLRDPVQNHLSWVCVCVENLVRTKTNRRQTEVGYCQKKLLYAPGLSYLSFSPLTLPLASHPPIVRGFAWLHVHSCSPDKEDNPNTDPMSQSQLSMCFRGQRFGAKILRKPNDR